jgi:hypothetical protein
MTKVSKLIGTVVGILASVPVNELVPGLHDPWTLIVTGVLAALGTYFAPANKDPEPKEDPIYAEDVDRGKPLP